jgi:hypothetical protein
VGHSGKEGRGEGKSQASRIDYYSCPAQVVMLAKHKAGELPSTTSEPPALVMMVAKGRSP